MCSIKGYISNQKVQDNLRDGLPYPYTEQDGTDYISAMLSANEDETFAFAIYDRSGKADLPICF